MPTGVPVLDISERAAPPQRESLTQRLDRTVRRPGRRLIAAPTQRLLELVSIQIIVIYNQAVATRRGLDRPRTHGPAQPHHTALHDLDPRGRWRLTPQRVGQPFGRHRLPRPDGQGRQHDPIPRTEPLSFPVVDNQWAE